MYTRSGPWHLPLRGTPCASCGQPAERLTVFGVERVVIHEDDGPPCRLAPHSEPLAEAPQQPRQAA